MIQLEGNSSGLFCYIWMQYHSKLSVINTRTLTYEYELQIQIVISQNHTKLHYDLTFPSITYYTVQHGKVIQREDMKRSALPIPLEVMPQNLQPVVVLAHCKATATEVAKKEITVKTIINVIIKF